MSDTTLTTATVVALGALVLLAAMLLSPIAVVLSGVAG